MYTYTTTIYFAHLPSVIPMMAKHPTTVPHLSSCRSPFLAPRILIPLPSRQSQPPLHHRTVLCSPKPSDDTATTSPPWPFSFFQSVSDWADALTELGVRKRRPFYTPDDWRAHRSSQRHLRHLLSALSSRVILSLVPPVAATTAFAAAISLYNSAVAAGWLSPDLFPVLHASSLPYQLTAPALALLLVFRTEASYSRFQEGRKAWMRVVAAAAEVAGMVMGIKGMDGEPDAGVKQALLNYIMAFPVALKCHVISGSDVKQDMQDLLEEDLAIIVRSKHRPRCVLEFISQSIQMLHMEETKRSILESKIHYFYEGIGTCEQLMGIPIPLSYTLLTSRFLVLWHLTLPVILWDDCNWIVVPATFISAASLFCIEEVGVVIEDPFPMLALDDLCKLFHNTIRETMTIEGSVQMRLLGKLKGPPDGYTINGRPYTKSEQG